jgi:cold shock CspA family protein
MLYGTIVRWLPAKGFGFIQPDRGPDVFFHISAFGACEAQPPVEIGRAVKYELEPGTEPKRRRPRAADEDEKPAEKPESPRARLVELIDKIPGAVAEADERSRVSHHPQARRKKPTWRR